MHCVCYQPGTKFGLYVFSLLKAPPQGYWLFGFSGRRSSQSLHSNARRAVDSTMLTVVPIESLPPRSPSFQVGGHQHQRRALMRAHPPLFAPVLHTPCPPETICLQRQHIEAYSTVCGCVYEARMQGNPKACVHRRQQRALHCRAVSDSPTLALCVSVPTDRQGGGADCSADLCGSR